MTRALVLGGGGNVGVAWETSLLAGLMDGGVDAPDADLIVGTSAGSVVGTALAFGRDPRESLQQLREAPPTPIGGHAYSPDAETLTKIFRLWAGAETADEELCRKIGALALAAHTMPEETWVGLYEERGWQGWPAKPLLVSAVDCESGALRAFSGGNGAPIARAVAASCTVPGLFPPVTIEGRRYMDGGVGSMTCAGMALPAKPDKVLMVSVIGTLGRGVHNLAARQIAEEKAALERAGASVRVLQFDDATQAAAGENFMDPSYRLPVAATGEAQGRRIASEIRAWWDGDR
jgi:NTE family protein